MSKKIIAFIVLLLSAGLIVGGFVANNSVVWISGVALLALAIVAVVLLALLGGKTFVSGSDKRAADKRLISVNEKLIDGFKVYARGDEAVIDRLNKLQEVLRYLPASEKDNIKKVDEKIGGLLGDAKIELVKSDGAFTPKVNGILEQIEVAAAERNSIF